MLRRRRSGEMVNNGLTKREKECEEKDKKERIAKLKMSPFPEEQGYALPLKETQKLNQLSEVKKHLSFSGLEKASPALKVPHVMTDGVVNEQGSYPPLVAAALKPSDVAELQKHVSPSIARAREQIREVDQGQSPREQPSASIRTMWDSVVSWMKTAVDYIAFENPEDVAMATSVMAPHGKKRSLTDSDLAVSDGQATAVKKTRNSLTAREDEGGNLLTGRSRRASFGRQRKKNGRRMSFGGLRRTAAGASGDGGLGDLLKLSPLKEASHSPPSLKETTTATSLSPSSSSTLPNAPATLADGPSTKSPTSALANHLIKNLSIKSPPISLQSKLSALPKHLQVSTVKGGSKVCKTSSLLASAMKFHSDNDGLNSILDGSPDPIPGVEGAGLVKKKKRIRRESLRCFYGNSVNSPNLTEVPSAVIKVRRSPRLAEKEQYPPPVPSLTSTPASSSDGVPLPPPPPPVPFSLSKSSMTPLTARIPPPPPLPSPQVHTGGHNWTLGSDMSESLSMSDSRVSSSVNNSRDVLQKMQSRLRKKMKKRGGVDSGRETDNSGNLSEGGQVDIRIRQWAEIQAYSRKMSLTEFLSFAEQKKSCLQDALEKLNSSSTLGSFDDITSVIELLQESAQLFPGGSKEMKSTLPLYKTLEKKIEVLTEFVQVSGEMRRCVFIDHSMPDGNHANLHTTLTNIRDEFESKHRHWSTILTSSAVSWTDLNLPVCLSLLARSQSYLCSLVLKFAHLSLSEASKMSGILVSIKCVRTTQVKERLKECLQLMHTALPYFTKRPPFSSSSSSIECCCQRCPSSREKGDHNQSSYTQDSLLNSATEIALSYITIAQDQFTNFVSQSNRQEVCEHFEGILKIVSLMKQLLSKVPGVDNQLRTSGILPLLPDAEQLGSALHTSCVNLIQHIVNQAQPFLGSLSPHSKEKKSKEIMLWMMFGCKYVNQTLEALGSDHADEGGILGLLNDLQQMECLLPD